ARSFVKFRASSKGLFRPAARGTGCQTRLSDPLSWFAFGEQGRYHLEVRIPGEYIDTNTLTRDSSTFSSTDVCGWLWKPQPAGAAAPAAAPPPATITGAAAAAETPKRASSFLTRSAASSKDRPTIDSSSCCRSAIVFSSSYRKERQAAPVR